jgi:hypothetical protein
MKKQEVKNSSIYSKVITGIFVVTFFAVGFTNVQAKDQCDKECRKALASARSATAKYHNVDRALEDGFINTQECVEAPGLGAMGIHFVRPDRIGNPSLNVREPEVLLYLPDEDGEFRLIGVEYVVPAILAPIAPRLYGRDFNFNPFRDQYDLHVWIWRHNPSGMFANFNPKLSCPAV